MLKAAIIVACLGMATPAAAGPFEDGIAAYQRGDYVMAVQLWRPLANQGIAAAQLALGLMYEDGKGVPKDYAEAVRWCRLAADQGFADAQFRLGVMYEDGKGVPKNNVLAYMWYNLAAAQGLAHAVEYRDAIEQSMRRSRIEEAQRLTREWKPTPPK